MRSLRFVCSLCFLCALLPVAAGAAGPITFGVKGGIAYAGITPGEIGSVGKFDWKFGPVGGGFATWTLSDRQALQVEVLHVTKGLSFGESEATNDAGAPIGTFETLQSTEYLEVPVLVRAAFPIDGSVRPAVLVGAAVAFKLKEELKTTGAVESSSDTDGFVSRDLGLTVGAEVRIRTGPGWSLIELRFTQGLIDVADSFYGREVKNRNFTVMAGYAF